MKATCTTMIFTDGTTSHYAVMVGRMKRKNAFAQPHAFNARTAEIVAIYRIQGTPDYRAMTAKHATAEAPAVYWQA